MLKILVFFTKLNWLLIPQFFIGNLLQARWHDSYTERGPLGVVTDGIGSALGLSSVMFQVDLYGGWSGNNIKKLLASYDIPMWGWGYAFDQFYFRVPVEDADLAYGVLFDAGVELL